MQNRKKYLLIIIIMLINKFKFALLNDDSKGAMDQYLEMARNPRGTNIIWPSKDVKEDLIGKGKYDPRDILMTRFQFHTENVFFVMPKYRRGVPFSLARMAVRDSDHSNPKIYPYPSWEDHDEKDNDSISNAVDIYIDPKNIIWILDVGIVNTLEDPKIIGTPKAIGIDPGTSKIKYSINFGTLVNSESRLQFLVAEVNNDKTTLYVSDAGARSIIVYDVTTSKGFRVVLPAAINQDSKKRDVLYLLIAYRSSGQSSLFFTYLGGKSLFTVKTSNFRLGLTQGSIVTLGVKPGKMVLLGTDNGQNIFFRFQGGNTVYLWNTENPFHYCNFVVVEKPSYCRMATHTVSGYRKLMWVLESNFQDYISGRIGCLGADARIHPLLKQCDEKPEETELSSDVILSSPNKFSKR